MGRDLLDGELAAAVDQVVVGPRARQCSNLRPDPTAQQRQERRRAREHHPCRAQACVARIDEAEMDLALVVERGACYRLLVTLVEVDAMAGLGEGKRGARALETGTQHSDVHSGREDGG
jgi:hypothetical protein